MPSNPGWEVNVGSARASDNAVQVMGSMHNVNNYYQGENSIPWVKEALFTSPDRQEQQHGGGFSHRLCVEGTREEILETLGQWAMEDKPDSCIFWLSGMAGTGKSTIARTFCDRSNRGERDLKVVSFFFCGQRETTSTATKLITTLAYQLTVDWGNYGIGRLVQTEINKAIDANPMLPSQNLERQWRKLIIQPLRRHEEQLELEADGNSGNPRHPPIVFVLDSLDECREQGDLEEVLLLLPELAQFRRQRIRVLITSRPDPPGLQGALRAERIVETTRNFSLDEDVDTDKVRKDIEVFVRHQLRDMSVRSPRSETTGPSEANIRELLDKSGNLFLYAATATRFMQGSRFEPPGELLRALLRPAATDTHTQALGPLYGIYNQILESTVGCDEVSTEDIRHNTSQLKDILGPIVLLIDPLPVHNIFNLLKLDCRARNRAARVLQYTQSVLHAPLDSQEPARILHMSLRDFLVEDTSSRFNIDERQTHRRLFRECLSIMDRYLVGDAWTLVDHRPDRSPRMVAADDDLPPEVHYACRYWMQHMVRAGVEMPSEDLEGFSVQGVEQWVDACTRLGYLAEIFSWVHLFKASMLNNPGDPQNVRMLRAIFGIGSLPAIREMPARGLVREAGGEKDARAAARERKRRTGSIAAGTFAAGFVCLCLLYVGSRGPLRR